MRLWWRKKDTRYQQDDITWISASHGCTHVCFSDGAMYCSSENKAYTKVPM